MGIIEYNGKIKKIENLTKNVRSFKIKLDKEINFKAGQFVNLILEDNERKIMRSYSICSNPINKKEIELCIKLIEDGNLTPLLWEKKENDIIKLKGPFGLMNTENIKKDKIVFIATGTGIAPIKCMIEDLLINKKEKKEINLIFATKYEDEILYEKYFEKLETENNNFKYYKIVSRPSKNYKGKVGHVQDNFDIIDVNNSTIFICGFKKMIESANEKLIEIGVLKDFIHYEKF